MDTKIQECSTVKIPLIEKEEIEEIEKMVDSRSFSLSLIKLI
jgi:hypothetical protein